MIITFFFLTPCKFLFLNTSEIPRSALSLLCIVLYLNSFREYILPPVHFLIISYASAQKKMTQVFQTFCFSRKINEPKLLKSHANDSSEKFKAKNQSVQSLSHVRLFVTPWTAAGQASLSITNSWILLKHMSIESVIPSNHLIL